MALNLSPETIKSVICGAICVLLLFVGFRVSNRGKGKSSKNSSNTQQTTQNTESN